MQENDKEKIARVTEAFLQMKKLDIAKIKMLMNQDNQKMLI
jgi:hypothetical protein